MPLQQPNASVDASQLSRLSQISGASAVPFARTRASVLLDLLRGLAALLVLLDHWRNLLFVDYPQLTAHRAFWAVPYVLTAAGHQAVVIFFVLSGYLISGSVFRSFERGTWRWRDYLTHRLVRLWIVLLPGLLLCVLWDRFGLRAGRAPLLYGGAAFNHLTLAVLPRLTPAVFFGNLFFLQGIYVPTLGSDGALWSLSFEFWYYLLFPFAALVLLRGGAWRPRLVYTGLFVLAACIAGPRVLEVFPLWLLGAALAKLRPPALPVWTRAMAAIGYVPLLFGLAKSHALPGLASDYVLGLATAGLLYSLLSAREEAELAALAVRTARGLARFSFTLYVVHLPFATLLTSLVAGDARSAPQGRVLLLGLGILAATLLYAWVLAACTEFHTEAARRWTERQLGRLRPFTASAALGFLPVFIPSRGRFFPFPRARYNGNRNAPPPGLKQADVI